MTVASQTGTGENSGPLQLVSPLEQMLDAAVESERPLSALARRARERAEERALAAPLPARAARCPEDGSDAAMALSARASAHLSARAPERSGGWPAAEPFWQRPGSEVSSWVRVSAVSLGVLALLTAFRLPLSPISPTRVAFSGPGAPTTRTPDAPAERASGLRGPGTDVANSEPHQTDAERRFRSPTLRPSDARDGVSMRATLESEAPRASASAAPRASLESPALRSDGPATSSARSEPPRASSAPAARRTQAETRHVAENRPDIYTVDDMFGVGGNEPLPPEALDRPAAATPPRSRAGKGAHGAPISSALFYQKLPF